MAVIAVVGEKSDIEQVGNPNMLTSTAGTYRRTVSRFVMGLYQANSLSENRWQTAFSSAYTSLWYTFRCYHSGATGTFGYMLVGLGKGAYKRIGIGHSGTSNKLCIIRTGSGGDTNLATESGTFIINTLYKYDVQITSFGASGTVNVYRANGDGTSSSLIMTYTGDLTTDSVTDLDYAAFQGTSNGTGIPYISEVIFATTDTRGMGLVTMEPTANGNTYAWSGSYADVDEVDLSDTDLIGSNTDAQVAQFAYNSSRIGSPSAIEAVVIAARGQAGGGITQLTPNWRIASTDYYGTAISPGIGFKPVQAIYATNPNTAAAWTASDLTTAGVNYGFRANT